VLGHNGNLTNAEQLKDEMFRLDRRHINTNSDSEVLLNVLAHELQSAAHGYELDVDSIFQAVAGVHRRCRGAYAVVVLIAGYGLLAFRDPHGIRPLVYGQNATPQGMEYLVSSESVALDTLGFQMVRDIEPGEAIFIDLNHQLHARQCAQQAMYAPCIFEYVYLARPDTVIDGVSVYEARLAMGELLAEKVKRIIPVDEIDVVIPIPDSSRPSAMQLAQALGIPSARVSSRIAMSDGPSSCPARPCARSRCARSSIPSARSSRASACCWSTTPSCVARPAAKLSKWRVPPARPRFISLPLHHRYVFRTSTASTCRPVPS
jgi:amidophosphoribosyltransferase